jgi:ABC-type Fe3+ transport system substrate-binding protein
MGTDGLLSGYMPKGAESPPLSMRGLGTGAFPIGVTFMAMAYNSKALKGGNIPESLEDLGDRRWAGRLGTQSLTGSKAGNLGAWYLSYLRGTTREINWRVFIDSLSTANRPMAYDCIDHLLQGLVDGEILLALTVYSLAYFREKASGSPVELVDSKRIPHMMTFTSAALTKGAEENAAARKFMDFLFTPEAQRILGGIRGIAPVRKGVRVAYDFEHHYGETTEFHPQGTDFERFEKTKELFGELKLP